MTQAKRKTESPEHGAVHCLGAVPYRMVVFARMNRATPLYVVAGSTAQAMGAKTALKLAHDLHGGDCFYCKKPIAAGKSTIDHAQPKAVGGGPEIQNLLIACDPCNKRKGAKAIELFEPEAGREWLGATLIQIQARLNRL